MGELNGNLKLIEKSFSVKIFHKGDEVKIKRNEKDIRHASNAILDLYNLTKKNKIGFLKNFNLPLIKKMKKSTKNKKWIFLTNYKNSISNLKLNINLYYKFSSKIPSKYNWYSLKENNEFIPSFTKKIFKQVSHLY